MKSLAIRWRSYSDNSSCFCSDLYPDVLAFDKGFGRLYVSADSGILTIFDEHGRTLEKVGEGLFAPNAHSVAVDSNTHRVFFPLQNVGGKLVLRIAVPSDKQL